ncbi:MAG TPA: FAD-dependent oxidoreductase [bacterium]|nr:FAD-dependent oxidoreductase [bacterium]
MKVVIIGASAAGLTAAQEARKISATADITLVSEEKHLPYHRPSLTELIGDDTVEKRASFYLQKEAWFAEQRIAFLRGIKVTAIDREKRTVALSDDRTISYDALVLAVGANSFVPMSGALENANVFAVRTLDDARKVAAAVAKNAVVIGGGLLGLETANALKKKGLSVHIIELADRALPMQLDPEGSTFFAKILTAHGMQLRLGAQVDRFEGTGRVTAVLLKAGETIPADLVVFSIGVRANIALAQAAGITANRGIVVNEKMETSVPGIYACGDCAEFGRGPQLWMPAVKQGTVAGANAAGGSSQFKPDEYPAMLKVFGTQLYSVGDVGRDPQAVYETLRHLDEATGQYRKLYLRGGRLVGGILIGEVKKAGALSKGIAAGIDAAVAEELLK